MKDSHRSVGRMFNALLLLVVGTFLIAALVTPILYSLAATAISPFPWPYSRVFDRVAMAVVLVLLILLRRSFSLRDLRYYLTPGGIADKSRDLLWGLAITLIASFIAAEMLIYLQLLTVGPRTAAFLSQKAILAIIPALLISLIEEGFFRVVLFGGLKRVLTPIFAAVICSAIYAVVHFIAPAKKFVFSGYSITVGFDYLLEVGKRFLEPGVGPALFGLFLVGLVLSYSIQRTRSFTFCVGLHTGWVFAMKLISSATDLGPALSNLGGVGRRYVLVGLPVGWASILGVFCAVWFLSRRRGVIRAAITQDPNQPILFASTNPGKISEAKSVAQSYGVWLVAPDELESQCGAIPQVIEDGTTYYDNAKKKALEFQRWSQLSVIADDSGLEVAALNGAPGIHSARYGGGEDSIEKLLKELADKSDRSAKLRALLLYSHFGGGEMVTHGELKGRIGESRNGHGGFGYDPIFLLDQHEMKSLAEAKANGNRVKTHRVSALEELFSGLGFVKLER